MKCDVVAFPSVSSAHDLYSSVAIHQCMAHGLHVKAGETMCYIGRLEQLASDVFEKLELVTLRARDGLDVRNREGRSALDELAKQLRRMAAEYGKEGT